MDILDDPRIVNELNKLRIDSLKPENIVSSVNLDDIYMKALKNEVTIAGISIILTVLEIPGHTKVRALFLTSEFSRDMPNKNTVSKIASILGFTGEEKNWLISNKDLDDGNEAVSIVQPIIDVASWN